MGTKTIDHTALEFLETNQGTSLSSESHEKEASGLGFNKTRVYEGMRELVVCVEGNVMTLYERWDAKSSPGGTPCLSHVNEWSTGQPS